jgi:hypothetical protein
MALFADRSNYEIVEGAPRRTARAGVQPSAAGRAAAAFAANAD